MKFGERLLGMVDESERVRMDLTCVAELGRPVVPGVVCEVRPVLAVTVPLMLARTMLLLTTLRRVRVHERRRSDEGRHARSLYVGRTALG